MYSGLKRQFKSLADHMDSPFEKFRLVSILLVVFSVVYYVLYMIDKRNYVVDKKIQNVNYFTFLWYSTTTNFTVPLGDIYPVSVLAKILMILHIWMFWFIMLA